MFETNVKFVTLNPFIDPNNLNKIYTLVLVCTQKKISFIRQDIKLWEIVHKWIHLLFYYI